MKEMFLTVGVVVLATTLGAAPLQNIALGKVCTFMKKPNYALTCDKDDPLQLTDGKYRRDNNGCLWTSKESVGWQGAGNVMRVWPPSVMVDLGADMPIRGFSWNLAFGIAGVTFPDSIDIYVSLDGKAWHHVGDMLARAVGFRIMPPPGYYNVYRAWVDDMFCHGRYVMFVPVDDPYCFVDEIEVYRGDDSLLLRPMPGEPTTDPIKFHKTLLVRNRLRRDADAVDAPNDVRARISTVFAEDFKPDFKTILPLNDVHRAIFAANARRLKQNGIDKPALWSSERWENFSPIGVPPFGAIEKCKLSIEMMRGEVRAVTVNVVNPMDAEFVCDFRVEGFYENTPILCQEVVFTDTRQYRAVSSALVSGDGPCVSFSVPAGTSKQVWISVRRPRGAAGVRRGRVVAYATDGTVLTAPLTVTLYDIDCPQEPTLLVGGWDYLNGSGHAKNMNTRQKSINYIRDLGVRIAWATRAAMPGGAKFDGNGNLAGPLDFTAWDKWIADVPGMRVYAVYVPVNSDFLGEKVGTARCGRMIESYCRAWGEHLRERGFDGVKRRVLILPFDEPNSPAQADRILRCIRPVRAAGCPEIGIFIDPQFPQPGKVSSEFWELCDVVCPLYAGIVQEPTSIEFYSGLVAKGKKVWLYGAHGPVRIYDPVLYYRRQAWAAYMIGGRETASQFWAFGCGGGIGNSWTAYSQKGVEYSPYFVTPEGPVDSKQCEGLREGIEDFELLCLYEARFGRDATSVIVEQALDRLPYGDPDWDVPNRPHGILDQLRVMMMRRLAQK